MSVGHRFLASNKIILLLVLIGYGFALSGCQSSPKTPVPTVTPVQRGDLAVTDFNFLRKGMSFNEIVSRVGSPHRQIGFGSYKFIYELKDETQVYLYFSGLNNLNSAAWKDKNNKLLQELVEPKE